MYFLKDICCICLRHKKYLRRLFTKSENFNYYSRLVLLFPELISTVLSNQGAICAECCSKVDGFYEFREQCLQNSQKYVNFTSQLSSASKTGGEVCVSLTDFKEERKELKDCEQSEDQCSSTDIFPAYIDTNCVTNEAWEEYYNNSYTVKQEQEENADDTVIMERFIDEVYPDNSNTKKIDIKFEPVDTSECEVELENDAVINTENRNTWETYCTSSTDMSQKKYNSNIVITEEIDIKNECGEDDEFRERSTGQDTGMDMNDETSCNMHPDDTRGSDIIKTEIDIKTEYEDTDEHEVKTGIDHTAAGTSSSIPDVSSDESVSINNFKQVKTTNICNICNETFERAESLLEHKLIHSERKLFKCEQCNKAFTRSSYCNAHKRIHSGENPFKCHQCNKAFARSSDLCRHNRIHSGKKPFKCDLCDKAFIYSSHLINHKRLHSGEKIFKCRLCDKTFTDSSSFIVHKRLHSGEKRFKCDHCSKAFTRSSDRTRHKRIHSGIKPYKCDQCNKAFSDSTSLVVHKRLHSGEKPFKCDQCNKAFICSSHLIDHKRSHSGEKPFQCDLCDKLFRQSSHVIRHKRIHSRK